MSNYGDGGEFARRTISCGATSCSAPGSPRSRVKFLCSHGGKILPRPSDGHLKYVGGETRVISVPRDISFQELMKRLTYLIDGEMILKYQLATEELDALVSVKSDEDLHHMIDEMEHYQMMGCPRMRTFLFPIPNHHHHQHQILIDNNNIEHQLPLDQRYIFSINGISPSASASASSSFKQHHHLSLAASSACTSPRSPDAAEAFNSEHWLHANHQTIGNSSSSSSMHKIQSSPSICNLNNIQPQQTTNHYSPHHLPPHHYHHHAHRSPNPPNYDTHNTRATTALLSMRSGGRFQPDSYNYYASRGTAGYCTKCMHHDNCSHLLETRSFDRQGTLP